jgi:hypothetical protein
MYTVNHMACVKCTQFWVQFNELVLELVPVWIGVYLRLKARYSPSSLGNKYVKALLAHSGTWSPKTSQNISGCIFV